MFRRVPIAFAFALFAFVLFALLLLPASAFAARPPFVGHGHPHFEADDTFALVNADGTLSVTFQEAGLGHVLAPIPYSIAATATASYDCLDAAGVVVATSGPITAPSVAFVSGFHNGQNTLTVLLLPPGPGAFVCPDGTTLALASASYTDVVISDLLNGISFILPGPFALALLPTVVPAALPIME